MSDHTIFNSPADAVQHARKKSFTNSGCIIYFLSATKQVISTHIIKKKTVSLLPQFSDIFIPAFYLGAKYILLVVGIPENQKLPTQLLQKESAYIDKLSEAATFLQIPVLDVIFLNQKKYYSALESGYIL